MVTPTMTEQEAIRSIKNDLVALLRKSDSLDAKYRREVLKRRIFPVRQQCAWISPSKNKWFLFLESRNRKEVGDLARLTFVCYVDFGRGYYAYMPSWINGKMIFNIYPPHFFSRYAERSGRNLTGVDLIKEYFIHNPDMVYQEQTTIKDEHTYFIEVYATTKEGVSMGVKTVEGNMLFRTFILYSMSKGEQIEVFAKNNEIRKEIHESQ